MYGTPSPENEKAKTLYGRNRFSVTRQLHYSRDETQLALDLCLFVNGLPVATFELKNSLTKQTVDDAVEQYKRDRHPSEKLFELGPLPGPLRRRRPRGAVLHPPQGQGIVVPALQPGVGRRRGQSSEPQRPQDRLPLEAGPDPRRADRHHRELRPDRGDEGRQDRTQEARADMAPLPPVGRGARTAWPTLPAGASAPST